jgi:hypothetical protein
MENVGIYVGTTPETIKSTEEAIIAILGARADEKTKRVALEVLRHASGSPSDISINNCSIEMPQSSPKVDPLYSDWHSDDDDASHGFGPDDEPENRHELYSLVRDAMIDLGVDQTADFERIVVQVADQLFPFDYGDS